MSTKVEAKTVEVNAFEASRLYFKSGGSVWAWNDPESHDPADRCGEPFRIHNVIDEDTSWNRWYLFSANDSHFPSIWVVAGQTFEDAHEALSELPYFRIDESDLKDYNEEDLHFDPNGNPVDMENVIGNEVQLIRAEA